MENLRELQKHSEKLQFEATCCRLWADGIQDHIMDEQKKVQTWILGLTDELIRLKRIQPAWIRQLQSQGGQQHLRHPWEHLPFSSTSPHHPVQLLPSASSQPRCQGILLWHLHRGMHRSQEEWELIHGPKQR